MLRSEKPSFRERFWKAEFKRGFLVFSHESFINFHSFFTALPQWMQARYVSGPLGDFLTAWKVRKASWISAREKLGTWRRGESGCWKTGKGGKVDS